MGPVPNVFVVLAVLVGERVDVGMVGTELVLVELMGS
jgi:hypothetical protein